MFTPKNPAPKTNLDEAIDTVLSEMAGFTAESEEYAKMVDQLVKLYALKEDPSKSRVSPDVLANIAANLLGILVIVSHERAHVIASKALAFIKKTG